MPFYDLLVYIVWRGHDSNVHCWNHSQSSNRLNYLSIPGVIRMSRRHPLGHGLPYVVHTPFIGFAVCLP